MSVLDEQLNKLQDLLIRMDQRVQENIHLSTSFMINQTSFEQAQINRVDIDKIDDVEKTINHLHLKVDWQCLRLLAQQSPVATDLRFVVAVIHTNTDLERVGDRSQRLAHLIHDHFASLSLSGELFQTVQKMSTQSKEMVAKAMESFFEQDTQKAQWVVLQDEKVDHLYRDFHKQAAKHIFSQEAKITDPFFSIYSVAKILERIADHATNIAENTIFISTGKDTRHQPLLSKESIESPQNTKE